MIQENLKRINAEIERQKIEREKGVAQMSTIPDEDFLRLVEYEENERILTLNGKLSFEKDANSHWRVGIQPYWYKSAEDLIVAYLKRGRLNRVSKYFNNEDKDRVFNIVRGRKMTCTINGPCISFRNFLNDESQYVFKLQKLNRDRFIIQFRENKRRLPIWDLEAQLTPEIRAAFPG